MRDISLHLLDIAQNSITAGADTVEVTITTRPGGDKLELLLSDNGCGMEPVLLESVMDPFTTTRKTRRFGMGLPLLKASAEKAGGGLKVKSLVGQGTEVRADFTISNIDRIPLGDVGDTISLMVMGSPERRFVLRLENGNSGFCFDTEEIKKKLGEVPINEINVIDWIREYINKAVKSIFGGVLNEVDC